MTMLKTGQTHEVLGIGIANPEGIAALRLFEGDDK
jgi:hypothetical protein